MKLYISGPMTAIGPPTWNFPAFRQAAAELRLAGYEVIDPSEKGIVAGWEWKDYLRYDLAQVLEVDGLALLPGWRASRGARLEVHVARALEIPRHEVPRWLAT